MFCQQNQPSCSSDEPLISTIVMEFTSRPIVTLVIIRKPTGASRNPHFLTPFTLNFFLLIALGFLLISSTCALPITFQSNRNQAIAFKTISLIDADVALGGPVYTAVPVRHTHRKTLRKILRTVKREIAKREEQEQQIFTSSTIPTPTSTTPNRIPRDYPPRICYFSPIQCVYTRD